MTVEPDLAASLAEVGKGMQALAVAFNESIEHDRTEREEERRRLASGRKRWYIFITCVMALLLGAVISFGTINYRALNTANDSNRRVEDCTLPGGACYKRKAAATLANNAAIVKGLDADNQKAVRELIQQVCNFSPHNCPTGYTPQPNK